MMCTINVSIIGEQHFTVIGTRVTHTECIGVMVVGIIVDIVMVMDTRKSLC
jgi:hypothetical protein